MLPIPYISSVIRTIKISLAIATVCAILALTAYAKHLHDKNISHQVEIVNLNSALQSAAKSIDTLKEQRAKDQERSLQLDDIVKDLQYSNSKYKKMLTKARSKEDVLQKKPGLVSKRINAAADSMFSRISCASDYRGDCETLPSALTPSNPSP